MNNSLGNGEDVCQLPLEPSLPDVSLVSSEIGSGVKGGFVENARKRKASDIGLVDTTTFPSWQTDADTDDHRPITDCVEHPGEPSIVAGAYRAVDVAEAAQKNEIPCSTPLQEEVGGVKQEQEEEEEEEDGAEEGAEEDGKVEVKEASISPEPSPSRESSSALPTPPLHPIPTKRLKWKPDGIATPKKGTEEGGEDCGKITDMIHESTTMAISMQVRNERWKMEAARAPMSFTIAMLLRKHFHALNTRPQLIILLSPPFINRFDRVTK